MATINKDTPCLFITTVTSAAASPKGAAYPSPDHTAWVITNNDVVFFLHANTS